MKLREIVCVFVGIGSLSAGEVDPSQKGWFAKYQKQANAPDPAAMLLNTDAEPDLAEGFVSLLNGKDLSNWGIWGGQSEFDYKDGVITGTCVPGEASTYLCTNKDDYDDFIFTCEMKWEKDLNSGVMFRGQFHEDTDAIFGPQVEMEGTNNKRGWSGGVYGQSCGGYWYPLWLKEHAEVRGSLNKEGWNRVTVMAKGDLVKTWLNGVPAAHWKGDGTYRAGYFGLQVHKAKSGEVLWRNLRVKELGERADRLRELDGYWAEVSRSVAEGDFAAYAATCHPDGILISGSKKTSEPLASALKRWKTEFDATKSGKMKASVDFRLSKRWGNATTAHETGVFRYASKLGEGEEKVAYIHLKALLVKKEGKWLILMENQESEGLKEEWDELGSDRWVIGGIDERSAVRAKIADYYPRLNEEGDEGRMNWNKVTPLVCDAISLGIFHEHQDLSEAIRVFGDDDDFFEDWMIATLKGEDWLMIPLSVHYSKLENFYSTIGTQFHLCLKISDGDKVGAIHLRECSPKIFTLESIKTQDFLKSEYGKRLLGRK
ncbi:MAG: ketosteroid isomerase-like protein [Akkermansiaceae bacterium]|jgi:ketosteroid isomerase-like protein